MKLGHFDRVTMTLLCVISPHFLWLSVPLSSFILSILITANKCNHTVLAGSYNSGPYHSGHLTAKIPNIIWRGMRKLRPICALQSSFCLSVGLFEKTDIPHAIFPY